MISFYQAYQAYERRRMRGELDIRVSRPDARPAFGETLLLRLATLLLLAGHALYRRYASMRTISSFPPSSSQEQP